MDGERLQSLIYRRQARGAAKAGRHFDVLRAIDAFNPLNHVPLVQRLPVLLGANAAFTTFNKYGNPLWYAYFDATRTQPMDILSDAGGEGGTYYIAAQQHLAPIMVVEAPRTVDVLVPYQQSSAGYIPTYGGDTAAQETIIMGQWPASILQGTKGEKSDTSLPDGIRNPWWSILLPVFDGIVIDSSFIIRDDLGRRFVVSSAELTDLGWRITAMSGQA
jgi:hypothetical protein